MIDKIKIIWIWWALLISLLIERAWVLYRFSLNYVDDDQTIMWHGAWQYGRGNFPEPFFFGQNYNTMLESLLALPFIKLGLPYELALPLISSLMILLPFVLLSDWLRRRGDGYASLVVLAIPLLLPVEYALITSMPRGNLGGIFIGFFAWYAYHARWPFRFFFLSFFAVLALSINPNCLLFLGPVTGAVLWKEFRRKELYLHGILGTFLPLIWWWWSKDFYASHPNYVVHSAWPLDFDLGRIRPVNWADLFGEVTPFLWYMAWVIPLTLLLLIGIALCRRNFSALIPATILSVLIFVSLTNNKVYDGIDSVFYSSTRMFLAIPLALSVILIHFKWREKVAYVVALLAIGLVLFKIPYTQNVLDRELDPNKNTNLYVAHIPTLKAQCQSFYEMSLSENIELMVVHHSTPLKHAYNYACPCLIEGFPPTIQPGDRRTWQLQKYAETSISNVLITGLNDEDVKGIVEQFPDAKVDRDPSLNVRITNNQLPTKEILDKLGLPMRRVN